MRETIPWQRKLSSFERFYLEVSKGIAQTCNVKYSRVQGLVIVTFVRTTTLRMVCEFPKIL